ncbi:hypothetical protein RQP46_002719 [Phenoliferia psychrophenolica]
MNSPVRKDLWLFGYPIAHSASPAFHNTVFTELNLPHRYKLHDTPSVDSPTSNFLSLIRSPTFAGAAITMPLKVTAMSVVDELETEAKEIGSINTIIVRNGKDGKPILVGQNYDWEGVRESIRGSLKPSQRKLEEPFGKGKCGFIIGGGGTTRAAVYALSRMGLSPIFLINRDPSETKEVVEHFPQYDVRTLDRVEDWTPECEATVAAGVGAIPSFKPVTPGEKNVYALATKIFGGAVKDGRTRTFLEMCYKPRVTILFKMAEAQGWSVVPGVEAMCEQALAQDRAWLLNSIASPYALIPADLDPRAIDKARTLVRQMGDIKAIPAARL